MRRISRRRFLQGSAATAAAAAAAAACSGSEGSTAAPTDPATTLAALTSSTTSPKGGLDGIEHVVVFMQENRSFDLYYGALNGVRGFSDPAALTLPGGGSVFAQPSGTGVLNPFRLDSKTTKAGCPGYGLPHTWPDAHAAWNGGRWDGWVAAKTPGTMGHFLREDLPFHYALADAFTICDRAFCSTLAGTNPNRLHLWTGMIDADGRAGGPAIFNDLRGDLTWTTYPERLGAAGVSWQVYQEADDFGDNSLEWFRQYVEAPEGSPLWTGGVQHQESALDWFADDVANGRLPQVSWFVANSPMSEHPGPSTPWRGAHMTHQLLDVLAAHPDVWAKTVFILTYDENDGYFDHVPPPFPAAGTAGEFVQGQPVGLGPRIPLLVISPFSQGGWVCSETFDHTSVIRFLETWLDVPEPNISEWRRSVTGDLTATLDLTSGAVAFPDLPATEAAADESVERGIGALPDAVPPSGEGSLPVQEGGSRPARPLPYRPTVRSTIEGGALVLSLGNPGAGAPVTFEVYGTDDAGAPAVQPFVVDPDDEATATWVLPAAGEPFAVQVHGPNGFVRSISGTVGEGSVGVAGPAEGTATTAGFELDGTGEVTVADAWVTTTEPVVVTVDGRAAPTVSAVEGWYDVELSVGTGFRFRAAGHIETGGPTRTGIGLQAD